MRQFNKVKIRTHTVLKIVTWYGHLRDTFAGKILTTFSQLGRGPKILSLILPAKVSRNLTEFCVIRIQIRIQIVVFPRTHTNYYY